MRERYVQQKKVGDSPSYEHLSRPYLEKMKFLDNFIQQRKSYRNVMPFSPMEIGESKHSIKMQTSMEDSFHPNCSATMFNDRLKTYTNNRMRHSLSDYRVGDADFLPPTPDIKSENDLNTASSSSSINSPQDSPTRNSNHNQADELETQKLQSANILEQLINPQNFLDTEDNSNADAEENTSEEFNNSNRTSQFPGDFLYPLYQQVQRQFRNSDQLFGELVASELTKMNRDRKKAVQKQILEILFFDD